VKASARRSGLTRAAAKCGRRGQLGQCNVAACAAASALKDTVGCGHVLIARARLVVILLSLVFFFLFFLLHLLLLLLAAAPITRIALALRLERSDACQAHAGKGGPVVAEEPTRAWARVVAAQRQRWR
jgi:hypothetical protein